MKPKIFLYQGDLKVDFSVKAVKEGVAIDTEAMGLNHYRDRLCLVQLSLGDGSCHLVQFDESGNYDCPILRGILTNPSVLKIFHYARFDVAILRRFLGVRVNPVYCTKIASKLVRTFCDRHGLKELCRELLGVEISKGYQSSDWGKKILSKEQQLYAAYDVFYLHEIKKSLDELLEREGRVEIARGCFDFIQTCIEIDLLGYSNLSVLEH